MMHEELYTALRDYTESALQKLAGGVPNNSLHIEVVDSFQGEEWTGIRMSKLPAASTAKVYISGTRLIDYTFQIMLKQQRDHTVGGAITFSTYLEQLASKLAQMYRSGDRPALPIGMELQKVEAAQQSTLNFSNSAYSSYVLDLKFTLKIRSI